MADRSRSLFSFLATRRVTQPPPGTTNSTPPARPTAQPISRQPTITSTTPRTSVAQTPSPPPATIDSAPISTPAAESQPVARQSTTSTINTTSPPPTTSQIVDQTHTTTLDPNKPPPTEVQTDGQPSTTTLTNPTNEKQNTSPSNASKYPSSPKPASPSRRTPQSRSPPQPSSPSRSTPQARPITSPSPSRNSKTPSTPQRPPLPHSLSRSKSKQASSNPPEERRPNSPSKEESRRIAQEEPHLVAAVKSDGVYNEINGADGTSFKHNEVKEMPSENLETSTSNGEHEALVRFKPKKHDETTDVKEVEQATKVEANEETKKEVTDFLNPKSGCEGPITDKPEIPSRPDDVHTEKQEALDRKEILHTSQLKKRNTNPGSHNRSAEKSGEHVSFNKGIGDDISKFVNQTAIGDPKNAITDRNMSIITLAGENRGASMQMAPNLREGQVNINRGYKIQPDEGAETTTDREGSSKGKKQFENAKAKDDQPTKAYVNNNVQGINNSIVFNASITEGSPGVHMVVTHVRKEPIHSAYETSPPETRKAEFNMSRAEKHTYEPTVRRRCLRGLLKENSDSDPENPEKPRRHGCRVGLPKGK